MWIADHATGGFIAVNEAALALYGYSRAEFLGAESRGIGNGGRRCARSARSQRPPAQGRRRHQPVHRHAAASNSTVATPTWCAPSISRSGWKSNVSCNESRRQTGRALLDAAADGSWLLGGDGQILDVNATYCRMSGYSKEELLKMNAADIEDPTSGETTMRLQLGRVRGGGRYETKHRRKDGTLFDVEVSVGLLENARGDSIVLIRDIAQRRRELVAQRVAAASVGFPGRPVQAGRLVR